MRCRDRWIPAVHLLSSLVRLARSRLIERHCLKKSRWRLIEENVSIAASGLYPRTWACTHRHAHVHTGMHTWTQRYAHLHTRPAHTGIHMCTHRGMRICTHTSHACTGVTLIQICMHTCTQQYAYLNTGMEKGIHTWACTPAHIGIQPAHDSMHVCPHACTSIHIPAHVPAYTCA